jgi:hypothetical protein
VKVTVTAHKLTGYRATVRTAQYLAEHAARIVSHAVPGQMANVRVVLTNPQGWAELATAADIAAAGGQVDRRIKARALRANRHMVQDLAGCAIPMPDGTALVLINADHHADEGQFAVTLVHELIHVMQFSRKGVRERHLIEVRDALGVEQQSCRESREYKRGLRADEIEACGKEYLADQIVPGCTA